MKSSFLYKIEFPLRLELVRNAPPIPEQRHTRPCRSALRGKARVSSNPAMSSASSSTRKASQASGAGVRGVGGDGEEGRGECVTNTISKKHSLLFPVPQKISKSHVLETPLAFIFGLGYHKKQFHYLKKLNVVPPKPGLGCSRPTTRRRATGLPEGCFCGKCALHKRTPTQPDVEHWNGCRRKKLKKQKKPLKN